MELSGDDESSDSSSDDFLVPTDKINFNSSFFSLPKATKKKATAKKVLKSSSESSGEEEIEQPPVEASADIFAEVLKNLQKAENLRIAKEEEDTNRPSCSKNPAHLTTEISQLLLQGESQANNGEESDEYEEPEEKAETNEKYEIPKDGITVTLPGSELIFKRRKRNGPNYEEELKRKLNQRIRSNQLSIHKVGLLCWLSHGFNLNRVVNDPEVLAAASKVLSKSKLPKGRTDLNYLSSFTNWFASIFSPKVQRNESSVLNANGERAKKATRKSKQLVSSDEEAVEMDKAKILASGSKESSDDAAAICSEQLISRLKEKCARSNLEMVMLYVAVLRAIGLNCRLVISLFPPHLKPRKAQLFVLNSEKSNEKPEDDSRKKVKEEKAKKDSDKKKKKATTKPEEPVIVDVKKSAKRVPAVKNNPEADKSAKIAAKKRAAEILKKGSPKKAKTDSSKDESEEPAKPTIASKLKSIAVNSKRKKEEQSEDKPEEATLSRKLRTRVIERKKQKIEEIMATDSEDESADQEEKKPPPSKKRKGTEAKKSTTSKPVVNKERQVVSSSDEEEEEVCVEKFLTTQNYWAEVYLESEESWISVSVTSAKVHCVAEIYKKSISPMLYVVAWNSNGKIKDVTRRYSPNWLTVTRKSRVEDKWWDETLSYWREENSSMSRAEDELLTQGELAQPLPKTIGECKGHPLYALQRHLLKYEAIYPPDAVPLGHLPSKEPIYSRHCIHTLCSRETWIKKARVVKPNQEPYKIVKAMPKYDKLSGARIKDQMLDLFGIWQTTDYVPPEAKDGKVPRNEYGNVDLFMDKMLPKGCVHIKLPALNRVAKKLNIDCAQAVVGFNFKTVGAVPAFEGYVVCEEYEDTLRAAWEEEQVLAAQRAKERREQRIYGNWRKLIRGMMIKQRLAKKYEMNGEVEDDEPKPSTSSKRGRQKKK